MNCKYCKPAKFCLLMLLVILTRLADVIFTYQYTSDLSHEANPLVSYLGFGWNGVLMFQILGIAIVGYLSYEHIFIKVDMNPDVNGLSFNSFVLHQYYGTHYSEISKKWNVFLHFPKGVKRNKYILGWVLPVALIIIGVQLIFLHLLLKYSQSFREIYPYILPLFYLSLILTVFLTMYLYVRVKFISYRRLSSQLTEYYF